MNQMHATVRMDINKTLYIKELIAIQFVVMEQSKVNNVMMEITTTLIAVQMYAD